MAKCLANYFRVERDERRPYLIWKKSFIVFGSKSRLLYYSSKALYLLQITSVLKLCLNYSLIRTDLKNYFTETVMNFIFVWHISIIILQMLAKIFSSERYNGHSGKIQKLLVLKN